MSRSRAQLGRRRAPGLRLVAGAALAAVLLASVHPAATSQAATTTTTTAHASTTTSARPTTTTMTARRGSTTTTTTAPSPPETPPPTARLVPVSLPPFVRIGGTFTARLHVDGPDAVAVRFTLHEPVTTLLRFVDTMRGDHLGEVIDDPIRLRLADLQRAPHGDVVAAFPLQDPAARYTHQQSLGVMRILQPGVYPLEIFLLGADHELDRVIMWIVAVDPKQPVAHPLRVAWLWNVRGGPLVDSTGAANPAVLDAARPGGSLDRLTRNIAALDGVRSTLAVTPELAQSWRRLAEDERPELRAGWERLKAGASRAQLLALPYVDIDAAALQRAGLGSLLGDELHAGVDALEATLGVRLGETRTALVEPPGPDVLAQLTTTQLADQLVLASGALSPVDSSLRFHPFAISGSSAEAAQTDDDVLALARGPEVAPVRAQRLLAALALLAFQVPDETRGVVFVADSAVDPSLAAALGRGLRANPVLRPSTLAEYFRTVEPARDVDGVVVTRRLLPSTPGALAISRAQYEAAVHDRGVLAELVAGRDPRLLRADRALQVVVSRGESALTARAALDAIGDDAHAILALVTAVPRTVTLTARRSIIPLTLTNATGRTVRIRVTLQSDKLLAPDGSTRVTSVIALAASPSVSIQRIAVQTRASGRFPVTVTLTSSDGSVTAGPPVTITVNSTAFGSLGSWLTYGALVFLALWWAHHIWTNRPARRGDQSRPAHG